MKCVALCVLAASLFAGCTTSPGEVSHSPRTEPAQLKFSKPSQSAAAPVTIAFAIEGDSLLARFTVTAADIYAKPQLAHDEYPYEFDVVELFVRYAKSHDPT